MTNIGKKALILTVGAFLLFSVSAYRVKAETLYILENLISNGNFSDELTGWVTYAGSGSYNINANDAYLSAEKTDNGVLSYGRNNITFLADHHYYISGHYWLSVSKDTYYNVNFVAGGANNTKLTTSKTIYSRIAIPTSNTSVFAIISSATFTVGDIFFADDIIIIDLTATFGAGFEPSLSDFETLYLPDLDYFDSYSNFYPDNIDTYNLSDYDNLDQDISQIDFRKSVIAENGANLDIDIYAYILDPISTGDPLDYFGDDNYIAISALQLMDELKPKAVYNGQEHILSWDYTANSMRTIRLDLDNTEKDIVKRILFNRQIDFDNEYLQFPMMMISTLYKDVYWQLRYYIVINSRFNMQVTIDNALFSLSLESDYEYGVLPNISGMILNFSNIYDQLSLPSVNINNDFLAYEQGTYLVNDLAKKYTNIKTMQIILPMMSPDQTIDPAATYINYNFHEIGVFSGQDIIMPSLSAPDSDIGDIDSVFEPTVAEWWHLGAHLKNLGNEIVNLVWVKINVRGLVASFDSIIYKVSALGALLPPPVWAIVAIVVGASVVGLIILVVDKIGGD